MTIECVFFDVGGTLGNVDDKLELHDPRQRRPPGRDQQRRRP
jgi:hypothetical protein